MNMLLSKKDYISMRIYINLMLRQAMMLRGEDRRNAELPELFIIESLNEDSNGNIQLLCLRLVGGKVCHILLLSMLLVQC